jgi:hypothetical protein
MNDEQRGRIAQMLGPINAQAAKNKLETDFEESEHRLRAYIEQQRIEPETLPYHKIREVVRDSDSMTIITVDGRYVHVSTDLDYMDSVAFSVCGHPDIEEAHNLGIIPKEQYDEYKKVQQDYLGRRREADVVNRLKHLVREAGADTIQEHLDEINK